MNGVLIVAGKHEYPGVIAYMPLISCLSVCVVACACACALVIITCACICVVCVVTITPRKQRLSSYQHK